MTVPISFYSSLSTLTYYIPCAKYCCKPKKSDVLLTIHNELQKPEKVKLFKNKVDSIMRSITTPQGAPYSSPSINSLNQIMPSLIIKFINKMRYVLSMDVQNPKDIDLTLSEEEKTQLRGHLSSLFPTDLTKAHQPYIDAFEMLADPKNWFIFTLSGPKLLDAMIHHFQSLMSET